MKKIYLLICMALMAVLCVGNLNAQDLGVATAMQLPLEQVVSSAADVANPMETPVLFSSRGNIARGTRNYAQAGTGALGYIEFDCENIQGATLLSTTTSYGAGYLNGTVYSYRNDVDGQGQATNCYFLIIEAATGTIINTIPRSELYAQVIGSVCYDHTSSTMYALQGAANNNRVRTIDLATGELTTISTVSGPAAASLILAMTMDLDGNMYALEAASAGNARFFSIDKATGVSTLIGATGKPANYAQSIAFDYNDSDMPLYWAQLSTTTDLNWMKINVATGAATLITPISWEICGLHFPYDGDNPPTYCPEVTSVTSAQFKGTKAKIAWNAPSVTIDLTGYKIYDGSTEIGNVPAGTTVFVTNNLAAGNYTFGVEAIYDDECTPKKVNAAPVTIKTCGNAIEGVDVVYDADCKATVTWTAAAKGNRAVLFDGGPMITHPGQGANGRDASAFSSTGQTLFGSNANNNSAFAMADDFTLTGTSTIETIDFFTYQTGSGLTPPITGVFVQIWNGAPNAGGTVIWGNMTTNIMDAVEFSNIYRVSTAITNADRPLFKVTAGLSNLELAAGTYWVEVAFTGSASFSGPWANCVEIMGQPHNGNGLQRTSSGWQAWIDYSSDTGAGTQEPLALPFVIYGQGDGPADPKYNVYMGDVLVASEIEATTYTHPDAVAQGVDVEWCVTQVCVGGGESAAGCKTAKCGGTPPCEPATITEVVPSGTGLLVTWTLPAGAQTVNIYRNGVQIAGTHTGTSYLDEPLEDGEYCYTLTVNCAGGVNSPMSNEECYTLSIKGNEQTFFMAPNPATGDVKIRAAGNINTIEVVSFLGQTVLSQPGTGNEATLDVSTLTNGIYFVRVNAENGTSVKKLVKQ
ncbi:MAG: T9SS type A sorting domain-containing protein [Lentimicrobiaceae bacterium]|nr:T9SS type A sorting domain-containing protein [Lentimicrobiaceae bacterium]